MNGPMLVSALVTGTLIIGGMLTVLGHGVLLHRRMRRSERTIAPIRFRLIDALDDPFDPEAAQTALRELPRHAREQMIVELAPAIQGESRGRLAESARLAGVVDTSRRACRSRRWQQRLLGARLLSVLGSDAPEMFALLSDRVPQVRAQAAEWATDHPTAEVIERLIDLLADQVPLARFSAHDALIRIGRPTVEHLLARSSTLTGTARLEALRIARSLPDLRFESIAVRASTDIDPAVRARGCDLLGSLAIPGTETHLVARLADTEPQVRVAAAHALGAVSVKAAAAHLPALLRDPSFDVRRTAAHSLRASGAVGTMLLRRMTEDDDRFAAEMARQTLALPEELLRR